MAFAGRSNVGKSSVINKITSHRNLARTSKTPGRTRELNYFSGSRAPSRSGGRDSGTSPAAAHKKAMSGGSSSSSSSSSSSKESSSVLFGS